MKVSDRLKTIAFCAFFYGAFFLSTFHYCRNYMKYRGVESWPSTSATITESSGETVSVPTQSRYGQSDHTIDSRVVEYQYYVGGKFYRSNTISPDRGSFPNAPLRAHYKPANPEIAVLNPVPYEGTSYLVVAGFSGILAFAHLWFTLSGMIDKRRKSQ